MNPFPPTDCDETNLPGFESSGDIDAWVSQNCPGVHIVRRWVCKCCGRFHYEGSLARTAKAASQTAIKSGLEDLKRLKENL